MPRGLSTFALLGLLAACSTAPSERTPSGALRLFLETMGETADDPSARARAYQLLSREARGALSERAREATAVSGRTFAGYEMLVEARYRLRFRPKDVGGFRERVDGDRAIVTVLGERSGDRAHVPMVRENGAWRVHLDIPRPERTTSARPSSP